ncbi:hypothetical protein PAXRUDRAFT_15433 [Paxillus rubicundulus Ve08.2h10]|uniref:Uncharacterized protein n=1 Tax=Paxillus rubicundulus Ve08.2h10 TaxID=930991 RepID=A0A0D0CZH3_9AGAM|nr:hypothetical protein PAXRUDRAFT_15433 [Paxillus rubicundulus Ve08.2h10]
MAFHAGKRPAAAATDVTLAHDNKDPQATMCHPSFNGISPLISPSDDDDDVDNRDDEATQVTTLCHNISMLLSTGWKMMGISQMRKSSKQPTSSSMTLGLLTLI